MKKAILSSLLLLLILSLLSSCLKHEKEYLPLGDVNLQMTEELTVNSRRLHFNFFTEEKYECLDNIIRYSSSSGPENIDITLIDVEKSEFCLTGPGPAIETIDLGSFGPGNYPVFIKVGNTQNTGSLQVTDETYIIGFDDPQMLIAFYDTLNRIPDDFFWGVVGYHFEDDEVKVDAFLDSLESFGAQPRTLTPGEYGYFQVDSIGKIIIPENPNFNFTESFAYEYTEPIKKIQDLIDYFYGVYPNSIFIYLYNSKGEAYHSGQKKS
jgi:hypothetical protein